MNQTKSLQKPLNRSLLALLCCLLWGSAFPCIKAGYAMLQISDTGSQVLFAGYRFFLAGLLTILIGSVMERKFLTIKKSSLPVLIRQGLLQTTAQYFFFYVGMANCLGSKASVINASNSFISILAAHFLIRSDKSERLSIRKILGCAVGFAGVIVVNLGGGAGAGFSIMGEGMILICSIAYGVSSVVLKMISDIESPITISAYQLTIGGVVLIIMGLVMGGHVSGFTFASGALLLYMALLSTVAFAIWTILLKYNPVGKVTIFGMTIPVFGVAMSAIFLKEQVLTLQNLAALICVAIGIYIVNRE